MARARSWKRLATEQVNPRSARLDQLGIARVVGLMQAEDGRVLTALRGARTGIVAAAEAFAEMLHTRLRTQWGFPDAPGVALADKLKGHYRGMRVSFGYPACPELADQRILFDLLDPAQIGLQLTEGFMMDPEASVSALVFHHPEAKYFKAG